MPSARVLPVGAPRVEVCCNRTCEAPAFKRGACSAHYHQWIREQRRIKERRERKAEFSSPPSGMGIISCAVCGRKMAEHRVTEWCAMVERFRV